MSDLAMVPSAPPVSVPVVTIRPAVGWQPVNLADLWRYRGLLLTLAARDVKVRYKQTLLGAAWAVIQPLAQMIVFTAFFAARGFSTEGIPAPVFYFTGLLPWQLFASSVSSAGNSLVANRNLITKVYFPRLVIPMAAMASAVVDFTISFVVLLGIMAMNHVIPSVTIVLAPLFVLLTTMTAFSIGIWLSALNVEFRDVQYVIPFVVQFCLFITPVIYPSSSVTGYKRLLLGLNPMTGVVEGFRWCVTGHPAPGSSLVFSIATSLGLLLTGLFFFKRVERTFADAL